MSRPKRLRLGAYTIPVVWHKCAVETDTHTTWGVLKRHVSGMQIDVTTEHYDPPQNLLHEAMHAVLTVSGVTHLMRPDDEEAVVEAATHGFIELLRRNKGLAEYLTEGE